MTCAVQQSSTGERRGPSGGQEPLRERLEQMRQPWRKTALLARLFGLGEALAHGEGAVWESAGALEEAMRA